MRIPLSVEKCLTWIADMEVEGGGIAGASDDRRPYPEVTGYLIPSLLKWGQEDRAQRCGRWLLRIQNENGGFPDRDGYLRPFDTAMAMQGFAALPDAEFKTGSKRAWEYLGQWKERNAGWPSGESRDYFVLVESIYASHSDMSDSWWDPYINLSWPFWPKQRLHYIAYALEGMQRLRMRTADLFQQVSNIPWPLSYWYGPDWSPRVDKICVCGNLQMAFLLKSARLLQICELCQKDNGGFPFVSGGRRCIAWAAKYYLDAAYEVYAES